MFTPGCLADQVGCYEAAAMLELDRQVAAERRFEERWRGHLEGLGDKPDAVEKMSHALDLGMTPGYMQMLAKELWRRPELVQRLIEAHRDGPVDHSRRIWTLLVFLLWHGIFVEERIRPEVPEPAYPVML